jgi:hypothetical protein
VKKGSNAWATTSGAMPVPVSETQSDIYCPGGRSRSAAPGLVASGRIADARRVVADERLNDVAEILEAAHCVERNEMAEM